MPVLMGDDEGEKPIIALEKQFEEMRLDRDRALATIAERDERILALEEQLAEARKDLDARDEADRVFSPSIQAPLSDDVKETHRALRSDDGTAAPFATPARTTTGGYDRQATSVAKKLMKKQEEGVLASPNTRKACPNKLPKPSPDDPKPPKKSEKKNKSKGFPWV